MKETKKGWILIQPRKTGWTGHVHPETYIQVQLDVKTMGENGQYTGLFVVESTDKSSGIGSESRFARQLQSLLEEARSLGYEVCLMI